MTPDFTHASLLFSIVFAIALTVSVLLRLWLAGRQVRHVAQHREQVPAAFADRIALSAHQRAADYTVARLRLGLIDLALSTAVLLGWTLLGGLQWLHALVAHLIEAPGLVRGLALAVAMFLIGGLIDLPLSWWRQFRLEQAFGFNRMSPGLWVSDLLKGALLGALLGLPLLAAFLWLMERAGVLWWLAAWVLWMGFNVFVLVVYPVFIAPWFNRFEPLPEGPLRTRVEALLARCGFASRGLFVMDGSRRSAHGNAYFTGLGRAKRIVFFDTLLSRLDPPEVEAVLAHELGHFHHRHIARRIVTSFVLSLAALALLGWLARQPWFYQGLGVTVASDHDVLAVLLFALVLPTFTFLLQPLASLSSRRHEFQADAFAARQTRAEDLASALVKLYEDNAATLTPDPVHSAFYDSHPPAAQRIGRLLAAS